MKLLIVEDDRRLSQTLVECVAPTFTADQAFDGAEGLYFAEQGVYDLIILDLMLPRMDGYTVLERLRAQRNHTPVLILTAKGETADKVRGLRAGADDYLAKPFSMDELASRIEAILRRSLGTYELHAEPPVYCQEMYKILDSCVQAVLTDENADPQALLDKAAEDFQRDYLDKYNSGAEAQ